MRQRGDSGIQSAEHIKNKEQHAGRRYQVWNQHGRRYGSRLRATITNLPVDNLAAAQHLVVGVLLHGQAARSRITRTSTSRHHRGVGNKTTIIISTASELRWIHVDGEPNPQAGEPGIANPRGRE